MTSGSLFVLVGLPRRMHDLLGQGALERLSHAHPEVRVEIVNSPERFADLLPGADGVFVWQASAHDRSTFRLPPHVLKPGARLRWVQVIQAGANIILTSSPELLDAEHITITSSKGPMGPPMAEHIALMMLALARDLPGFLKDQAERRWRFLSPEQYLTQLFGKTIAILGVGEVGGNLARICKLGFGMRVLGMTRTRRDNPHVENYFDRKDLNVGLAESDVVALCLPLTPDTERMIDAAALASMRPTAYLINVTRGGLVDEAALIDALRSGRIAGAGLDTTAVEPLPDDSPLWTLPNVIITPHSSPFTDRFGEQMVDFWCENLRRFAENRPFRGIVDRHAGY